MSQEIINLFKKGAEANNADKYRQGNLICLPSNGSLVISGDIHGNWRNFERIYAHADLTNNPDRHLILQEIIHGGPEDSEGGCLSYKLLLEAINCKMSFPGQVHFIMSNHDTAFITSNEVMKNGRKMNLAMESALNREFGQDGPNIKIAIKEFLFSQPLAVKCDNRIWISHSLPNDRQIDKFDQQIFDNPIAIKDLIKPGSVYFLTWGRKHSQKLLNKLAGMFDVDIFVLGHQPQTQGWSQEGKNLIIIDSEHNHGCLLSISLEKSYTMDQLIEAIVPLASIP